jgi:hypothetical protein
LSGGKTLLEGLVLGLPGPIDEKPADQPRARPSGCTEPGIAADRAKYRATTRADGRAGQRALLGRRHIGASRKRHSDGREQQQMFHGFLQSD